MSFFRITKRPNTANIDLKNHDEINSKIEAFLEKSGAECSNFVQLFNALLDYAVTSENQTGIPVLQEGEIIMMQSDVDDLKLIIEKKSEEITTLTENVKSLDAQLVSNFEKELQKSEAMENVLLVPCSPEQKEVLEGIAQNRFDENYDDELATPAEIVLAMVFRKSNLYNHFDIYYTGL